MQNIIDRIKNWFIKRDNEQYNLPDQQVNALALMWKDPEAHNLIGDTAFSLMKYVIFNDIGSAADAARSVKALALYTPTILYWDKMSRYMRGVFKDGSEQVKMAQKFEKDNPKYISFVKKMMNLINEFSDDMKIDYLANLTRCYLFTELEDGLYLKLAKFISMCTPTELVFLAESSIDTQFDNSMMAASLLQYGLLAYKKQEDGSIKYVLSDFGIALKQNSLNFDDGTHGQIRLCSYDMMTPMEVPNYVTSDEIGTPWIEF